MEYRSVLMAEGYFSLMVRNSLLRKGEVHTVSVGFIFTCFINYFQDMDRAFVHLFISPASPTLH